MVISFNISRFCQSKTDEFKDRTYRRWYPNYCRIDPKHVISINTDFATFNYSEALQNYPNLFEDIKTYDVSDLTASDVVLDLGAFVGAFSIAVAFKAKQVYAVEPLFDAELEANISLNGIKNVHVFPYALGGGGYIEFCYRNRVVIGVSLKEILKLCEHKPTFLKMDCEGGEWSVPIEEFASFRAIEAEIHTMVGARKPEDFIKGLESLGFVVKSSKTREMQTMISARRLT